MQNDAGIRVPMVIAGAGLTAGKVVNTHVSHVDLIRILLGLTGAELHSNLRGTDLSSLQ